MEDLEVSGWIEIFLKSELMELKVELQALGKAVQGSVKDKICEDMPGLAKTFAGASAEGATLSCEGKKEK